MGERASMRDRVQTGNVMVFIFLITALSSWWWNSKTTAVSLWWVISIVSTIGSVILFTKGVQLVFSGFSGFGRNFFEPHETLDPSPESDSYDHTVAVNRETAGALALPMVLLIFGGLTLLTKIFPTMNRIPESDGANFVPPHFLTPLIFTIGFTMVTWSILVRVMMKTGPDRWTYVPGTREQLRSYTNTFIVIGVLFVALVAWFSA
jgi:hypothetical protein